MQKNKKSQQKQIKEIQNKKIELKKDKQELKNLKINTTKEKKKSNNPLLSLFKRQNKDNSVQHTIPYDIMYKDGICKVNENLYTKTVQFFDITYQLAKAEDKQMIFENWCNFLNYFDNEVYFQLSFLNQSVDMEEYKKSILIDNQNDDFNSIRKEYKNMLKEQIKKGNNGIVKTKYITFGVKADSLKAAKLRLERIEADILINFKSLGVTANPLNGHERLLLLYKCMHENSKDKFNFNWNIPIESGLSTKDFIAPNSIKFLNNGKSFKISNTHYSASFLQIITSDLEDNLLAKLLDLDGNIMINFHVKPIDQLEAIKKVKRKITDINSMIIDEQKKAVRSGYDFDNIPNDLRINLNEMKEMLEDLQSRNQRLFLVTIIIMNTAKTLEQLENYIFQVNGIVQQANCSLRRLEYQQEQAFQASLPLGINKIEIERSLTTSGLAIFVPFTTSELFQSSNESLYYGINALSNNLIMANRKLLTNPNGLILGTSGSGKSFAAKREIVNSFLCTSDDIIVVDPENEYTPLVSALKGQIIEISPISKQYINPLDINLNYSEDDDPVTLKSDFVISLCELIIGGKKGLEPVERTIIDRCVRLIYRTYFLNPIPKNMPILEDLYNCLNKQEEIEAKRIATALEFYVKGSMSVFNHKSNINIKNRVTCYNIKALGKNLKKIGLLIVQDNIWNRVSANRDLHKETRCYIDEMHLLLKDEQTASFTVDIWKRFRKWGGIPTGITQNVKDILKSQEIENIFENTDFYYLLKQAAGDREILAKKLNISVNQLSYITNSAAGEGLLIYGNAIIPFVDRFPKDTELYKIMTTKPQEMEG